MHRNQDYFPDCPEGLIVGLARTGDRGAFAELVHRYQSPIRQLMRRCCGNEALADDLAQQVFLQVWLRVRTLKKASAFGAWIRRLAISIWLQHVRKNDPLSGADELSESGSHKSASMGVDLDRALASLPANVRLCIVLSYHEGMSHQEIAEATDIPLGTVKSHINRGSEKLRQELAAYGGAS